jgi:hypothetical protein
MLFIIVPIIVFIIAFIYMWVIDGWELGFVSGLLFGTLSVFIVLIASLGFTSESNMEIGQVDKYEIHALVDNASYKGHVSGNVFLISGYVGEELEYRYMYKVDGKGYAFNSIDADDCYLNITSGTPILEVRNWKFKSGFLQRAFGDPDATPEYIFYLPENAEIINEFKVDFE